MPCFRGSSIKASEVIKLLQEAIKKHGDKEVWKCGDEFPSGISDVKLRIEPDNGYYPTDVFVI